jgi:hypothetical protein
MKLYLTVILVLILVSNPLLAQRVGNINLSRDGISKIVNKKMSSLVTGSSTGSSPISFASFDPSDGSFIFKGTLPLTSEKKSKSASSYRKTKLFIGKY